MFYDGVGPSPAPIIGYNLSACASPHAAIPSSEDFIVLDITVCGITYAINQTFASRAGLLTLLNGTFVLAFGLNGTFTIDPSGDLIFETREGCEGTNCITLEDPDARIFEDNVHRAFEDGTIRLYE